MPLDGITEAELARFAAAAERLLTGRALARPGNLPHRRAAGHGAEFLGHRAYSPGDEIRHIDWRASARSRNVQVRRFRREFASHWLICLDGSASMALDATKWALARQLTAAFAYLIARQGNSVAVAGFSDGVDWTCAAGRGRHHYATILNALRRLSPRARGGASRLGACAAAVIPTSSVVVVSDFLAPDAMRSDLARLLVAAEQVHAIQVLSAHECDAEVGADAVIEDVESGLRVTAAAEAAAQARMRLAELREALARYCRGRGIVFSACDTRASWKSALAAHLRAAAGSYA
jgi:uncharacterized protein (DUF58 family)